MQSLIPFASPAREVVEDGHSCARTWINGTDPAEAGYHRRLLMQLGV